MNKLTLVCCLMLIVISSNANLSYASSTSCEILCFFECLFVSSPCKTDDCPCPDVESTTGNSTISTEIESSTSNSSESTGSANKTDSFTLKQLKSYLSSGSGQSKNGSTGGSGSYDYSQYTKQGAPGSSSGDNKTTSSGSSGSYDYSAYNTEPATIPSNPNGGFDYSEYNTAPSTIPKNGGGSA